MRDKSEKTDKVYLVYTGFDDQPCVFIDEKEARLFATTLCLKYYEFSKNEVSPDIFVVAAPLFDTAESALTS